MASSRTSSNSPDWQDISRTMDALEQDWAMPVEIRILHSGTPRTPELQVIAYLVREFIENGEVKRYASAQRSLRAGEGTDLEAVLLVLLYALDGAATAQQQTEMEETP